MTLQDVKKYVVDEGEFPSFIIFKCADSDYVPLQYVKEVAKDSYCFIESLEDYTKAQISLEYYESTVYVYRTDELTTCYASFKEVNNLVIICNKIDKNLSKEFSDYIVEVPKLEKWQIKDYIAQNYLSLTEAQMDSIIENCRGDVFKIDIELNKLKPFLSSLHSVLYDEFERADIFESHQEAKIFDLVNAIQSKDVSKVDEILNKEVDINSIGLISMLHNGFKNIIKVWFTKNPNEMNTGLKNNQIWAINKLPRVWSRDQLIQILKELTEVDCKIKSGEMPEPLLTKYVISRVLAI